MSRFSDHMNKIVIPTIPEPDYDEDSPESTGSSRTSSPKIDYPTYPDKEIIPKEYLEPYKPGRSPRLAPKVAKQPTPSAEPNKAYLLHLKNHNKYATVKNFANFSNCPICQIYQNGYIGNYPPPAAVPVPAPAPVKSAGIGTDHKLPNQVFQGVPIFVEKSPRISKKVYETNNKYDYVKDSLEEPDGVYVKVLKNRKAQAPQELTIQKNEFLRVIDNSGNWWACEDRHGNGGYVPKTFLSQVTSDAVRSPEAHKRYSEVPPPTNNLIVHDQLAHKRKSEMPYEMGWRPNYQWN